MLGYNEGQVKKIHLLWLLPLCLVSALVSGFGMLPRQHLHEVVSFLVRHFDKHGPAESTVGEELLPLLEDMEGRRWTHSAGGPCAAELPEGNRRPLPGGEERIYSALSGIPHVKITVRAYPPEEWKAEKHESPYHSSRDYSVWRTGCLGVCYTLVRSLGDKPACKVHLSLESESNIAPSPARPLLEKLGKRIVMSIRP